MNGFLLEILDSSLKEFWYQSKDPGDYEPMTTSDVLRLAFPNSGAKNRSEMTSRALKALTDLSDAGDVQIMTTSEGLIVMPPSTYPVLSPVWYVI